MASNIVYQAVINVLMYFYTDVYGIEAAAAGTLMVVVRVFDAITDPIMGAVADRTRSRWGRYRPWLLWMAVPYGILAVTAFITPDVAVGNQAGVRLHFLRVADDRLHGSQHSVFGAGGNDDLGQGRALRPAILALRHGNGGRLPRDGFDLAALEIVGRRW
jgi:MFS family permease